jgi:sterigmatocystin 8-O-methyltransferase
MDGYCNGCINPRVESLYPFQELPAGSLLVDIGGGSGHNSVRLVSQYPNLRCIVQDYESVVSNAKDITILPDDIASRIEWQAHDYYIRQPCKGATLYLFSHVLMDNDDANCIKMIRSVVEAMDSGVSRILVYDFADPPTYGYSRPPIFDMLDLHCIANNNVHSRSEAEWDVLFTAADERLVRQRTWAEGDGTAVLEFKLT